MNTHEKAIIGILITRPVLAGLVKPEVSDNLKFRIILEVVREASLDEGETTAGGMIDFILKKGVSGSVISACQDSMKDFVGGTIGTYTKPPTKWDEENNAHFIQDYQKASLVIISDNKELYRAALDKLTMLQKEEQNLKKISGKTQNLLTWGKDD